MVALNARIPRSGSARARIWANIGSRRFAGPIIEDSNCGWDPDIAERNRSML